jgi:division protein CdvB (Snf7/Vps24/ESCRT-III family)
MSLFSKLKDMVSPPDPIEQMKEWKRAVGKEMRSIDREVRAIEREEKKQEKECKAMAKKGQRNAALIIAKNLVRSRKTRERMVAGKASMNSVQMQLQSNIAMTKAMGCMKRSTEVMQAMSAAVKMPEVRETMATMAREMERAGLIEEMMMDTLDEMDADGVEEEADGEVTKVIEELTATLFQGTGEAPVAAPQAAAAPAAAVAAAPAVAAPAEAEAPVAEGAEDSGMGEMQDRLRAL